MASNISVTPVTSGGAGPPTTTILSQAQATQLIQKLRAAGGAGGLDGTTGAIKIQAVQTNPQTGVRQIIAIPIQASSATTSTSKISVSPLKAKPPMQTIGGATPPVVSGTTASLGPNVKVVKLASFPDTHVKTSTAHVVNHAQVEQRLVGQQRNHDVVDVSGYHSIKAKPTRQCKFHVPSHGFGLEEEGRHRL